LHDALIKHIRAWFHMEKLKQKPIFAVHGHEGAFALAAHQNMLMHEFVHRFAQRANAYLQRFGNVRFVGQRLTGTELP
jgi:hypothetical protein